MWLGTQAYSLPNNPDLLIVYTHCILEFINLKNPQSNHLISMFMSSKKHNLSNFESDKT